MVSLNESDLKNKKWLVAGLQGTGKTHFARYLAKHYNSVAVYTPHPNEWEGTEAMVFDLDFEKDFEKFLAFMKKARKLFDCIVVDEADMLFRSHFDVGSKLREMIISHRHYGLSIIFCSRRPQDIPAQVYNQFENLALFSIEAPQVKDLLNRYYENLGEKVTNLDYGEHSFIFKQIGKEPKEVRI